MYIRVRDGLPQGSGPTVWPVDQPVTGLGDTVRALPEVTGVVFRNGADGATPSPDNCCAICVDLRLGVRQNATASNGMEMIFTLSGHRRGIEYDITRTVRASIWQRASGVWTRLLRLPMGTPDDEEDRDECLEPWHNRIFVVDAPGVRDPAGPLGRLALPAAHIPGLPATATHLVLRHSFAEWVIARSTTDGIPWTPLRLPPRGDGTRPRHIYWHSIECLTRDQAGNWDMDLSRSRIGLGSLSAAIIDSPPS
jgi:hypothetical protein